MHCRCLKKIIVSLLLSVIFSGIVFSAEKNTWTLACTEFEFTQNIHDRKSSEQNLSQVLPSLILEQIAEGLIRTTSDEEMLDRALDSYLTDRQSLFLQLSKEVQLRDSYVLTVPDEKKMKKKIRVQEKKIAEIEEKISKNLENCRLVNETYLKKKSGNKNDLNKEVVELLKVKNENVKFYNDDIHALYKFSDSRVKEQSLVQDKINALFEGKITVYKNFFSVTVTMTIFPGNKVAATLTEVGSLKDAVSVAKSLASYFMPYITNNLPVKLFFDVKGVETEKVKLTVDSFVYDVLPKEVTVPTGIHTIKFESEGYDSQTVKYEFKDSPAFKINVEMKKTEFRKLNLVLKNPVPGKMYANGKFLNELSADCMGAIIECDGTPLIGQFRSNNAEKESFFYYVPSDIQLKNTTFIVKGKSVDADTYIDNRRIWMYRAYSLLVLSMPFTLYSKGKYISAVNAYNSRTMTDLNKVYRYEKMYDIATGITIVCAGFFGYELIRYLIAANKVLPAKVVPAKDGEMEAIMIQSKNNFIIEEKSESKTEASSENKTEEKTETE